MERVSGVLFSLYRGSPRHEDWAVACLAAAWPGIVGPRLAAESRPARIRRAELVIEVRDRGWAEAVTGLKPRLLEKLRAASSGAVRDLVVVVGPPGAGERTDSGSANAPSDGSAS